MIITRTPFRVSFAGGGTDIEDFYKKEEGCTISTSINKYMYIVIHPTFDRSINSIKYSKTEIAEKVNQIKHPIARQVLMDYNLSGVEITSISDVPSGTGLGSSSAYTVGLLNAVNAYVGKYKSQERLAHDACEIEIEKLGEPIGKQDQYGCAIGGFKFIRYKSNGDVIVEPILLSNDCISKLNENLLMFYTGYVHSANQILEEQKKSISEDSKFENLRQMAKLARDLHVALINHEVDKFGDYLHRGWLLKKELTTNISNSDIDKYYEIAMNSGARGGKLLGAGGGGFLLFYCDKDNQKRLRSSLSDLYELKFSFDFVGTNIIHVGNKDWD